MSQNEKHRTAWELNKAGWKHARIAKKLNISIATVKRYINKYSEIKESEPPTVSDMKITVEESWAGLRKILTDVKTPAHVKTTIYLRALNSEGEMIEKKELDLKGKLPIELGLTEAVDARIGSLTDAIGGIANAKK